MVRLPLNQSMLSRMKWEYERNRTGDDDLLCLGTADMDFRSPDPILKALSSVIENGHLGYPFPRKEYFDSIHRFLLSKNWDVDVEKSIQNNVGIYSGIWTAIDSLSLPGDEIIFQTPVHFCFKMMIEENGRIPVENPLVCINGRYEMDIDNLERCFTDKTRIFWLCNPHNPVGRAWTAEELMRLAEICLRHNVIIVSDDVYFGHVYKGTVYTPIASLSKEISENTITFYSTSKSFNTTGLKHSFLITENESLFSKCYKSLRKLDLHFGITQFGIEATIAAFNECGPWLEEVMELVDSNRSFIQNFLTTNMPKAYMAKSDSTYFAWINFTCLDIEPQNLASVFEKEGHVEVGNGSDLGTGGDGWIRLNMGCSLQTLSEAMRRMKEVYDNHLVEG